MNVKDFTEVNGTELYFETAGEGEPLVLLHSGYTDSRLWDGQFELYAKYFKVIRFDIRGFGRSGRPNHSFSFYEDLKCLLDYLKIKRTSIIGASMGGSIAIDFTLEYPDSVVSLILSGPSLNGYTAVIDEAGSKRSLAGMSIVKKDENFNESIEFMLNDPMWRQGSLKARRHLKKMFTDTSLEWCLQDMVIEAYPPASERLSEIKKRTLLIVGSEDSQPILEIAGYLESNISMLQKVIINGTGHLPNLDKPDEFNKAVLDFLFDKEA